MDSVRMKHGQELQQRKLLLPLSFGVSSTTMLEVLDSHLDGQAEKSGRLAYALHVLHVDISVVEQSSGNASLKPIKERFPRHTYSTVAFEDAMDLPGVEHSSTNDASTPDMSNREKLHILISSATSATARTDLIQILRTKLIANYAKQNACEAILWGDSTTKLAEKTLAETAKGRGFSIPWAVTDGESVHGIKYQYPMRDLLKKELVTYAETTEPPLTSLIVLQTSKPPVSAKNSTIDELMTQYFESVEKEYPSIVANVVRTTAKLEVRDRTIGSACCRLCELPFNKTGSGLDSTTLSEVESDGLCTSCSRSLHSVQ